MRSYEAFGQSVPVIGWFVDVAYAIAQTFHNADATAVICARCEKWQHDGQCGRPDLLARAGDAGDGEARKISNAEDLGRPYSGGQRPGQQCRRAAQRRRDLPLSLSK